LRILGIIQAMIIKNLFIAACLLFIQNFVFGTKCTNGELFLLKGTTETIDSVTLSGINFSVENISRPNPLLQLFRAKQKKNKKITAVLLAFPFPFGIVGLHRIYLGTAPYVPIAYIASLGGIFGILPFIDCCVLLLDKDEKRFTENKKVFMWVN